MKIFITTLVIMPFLIGGYIMLKAFNKYVKLIEEAGFKRKEIRKRIKQEPFSEFSTQYHEYQSKVLVGFSIAAIGTFIWAIILGILIRVFNLF